MIADKIARYLEKQPTRSARVKDIRAALNTKQSATSRALRKMSDSGLIIRAYDSGTVGGIYTVTLVRMPCPLRNGEEHADGCYVCNDSGWISAR